MVFLNGYQLNCGSGSTFAATFGNADTVLRASQIDTLFFDNCSVPGKPSVETLGVAFGQFLAGLKYTDGSAVSVVDVVAHSMGGLVLRSYLSGKQETGPVSFQPPASTPIRKAIFLATPHFGTALTAYLGIDRQSQELTVGSQFLFDLNTWNDNTDDLRGIDALALVGDGGTGLESTMAGFDDGVVTLTSSSLGFVRPGRTRVISACHSSDSLLKTFFLCRAGAPSIAKIMDASDIVARIVVSFLNDTNEWRTLGQSIEDNVLAEASGGLYLEAQDQYGSRQAISRVSVTASTGAIDLPTNSGTIAFSERLPPRESLSLDVTALDSRLRSVVQLPAATVLPQTVKAGPAILRILPAAANAFPLNIAPGEFAAIYGSGFSAAVFEAEVQPFPLQLGGVQVLINGTPAPLQYVSPGQINFVCPDSASGLLQIVVQNSSGRHMVNLLTAAAVPAIFSLDGSGSGPAAALNGLTGKIVGHDAPLHAGDYAALFLTGLGQTQTRDGLDHAQIHPTVAVGGEDCPVTYAGRAPALSGIDQINCRIPAGISPGANQPVIVTSNGRDSNMVTVEIQ